METQQAYWQFSLIGGRTMTDKSVLITGAAGHLGRMLMNHLRASGGYQLVGLDKTTRGVPDVVAGDFSVWDRAWAAHFQGVDTVVHLGADPNPFRSWQEMIGPNMGRAGLCL